ncbi:hypothetical protein BC628DRAFT_1034355 [Trametes gibbosa]|nr:hypothetical protein BC628DRAFT_1034355 [Trametes gibbosa]
MRAGMSLVCGRSVCVYAFLAAQGWLPGTYARAGGIDFFSMSLNEYVLKVVMCMRFLISRQSRLPHPCPSACFPTLMISRVDHMYYIFPLILLLRYRRRILSFSTVVPGRRGRSQVRQPCYNSRYF